MILSEQIGSNASPVEEIDAQIAMIERWLPFMLQAQRSALPAEARDDLSALHRSAQRFIAQWVMIKPRLATLQDQDTRRYHRHELKNTLNTMGGFAYLMLREYSGSFAPEQFMAVQSVHSASRRLVELVNGL